MPLQRWENEGGLVLEMTGDGGPGIGGAIALSLPSDGGDIAIVDVSHDNSNAFADDA